MSEDFNPRCPICQTRKRAQEFRAFMDASALPDDMGADLYNALDNAATNTAGGMLCMCEEMNRDG